MAFRPQIRPLSIITNGSMSGNLTSLVTIIEKISLVSVAYSWSGSSPTGSLSLQVSNDYSLNAEGNVNNAGTWTTIYFLVAGSYADSISVSGSTGTAYADTGLISAYALRSLYTYADGGTGTLQAVLVGKVS